MYITHIANVIIIWRHFQIDNCGVSILAIYSNRPKLANLAEKPSYTRGKDMKCRTDMPLLWTKHCIVIRNELHFTTLHAF